MKLNNWELNSGYSNEYLTVKAIPQNETHVMAIKYESTTFLCWQTNIHPKLAKMYRSSEIYNIKKPILDTKENIPNDNGKLKLMIYPNPTANFVNILIEEKMIEKNLQINIYNLVGNLIFTKPLSNLNTKIDLNNYSKGMYNFVLTNQKDINITNKIIVK